MYSWGIPSKKWSFSFWIEKYDKKVNWLIFWNRMWSASYKIKKLQNKSRIRIRKLALHLWVKWTLTCCREFRARFISSSDVITSSRVKVKQTFAPIYCVVQTDCKFSRLEYLSEQVSSCAAVRNLLLPALLCWNPGVILGSWQFKSFWFGTKWRFS